MTQPRYSIGIDLGTTNCALSYVSLASRESRSEVLSLAQRDELNTTISLTTLPSFLYLPTDRERLQLNGSDIGLSGGWIVGLHARKQTSVTPDRVAASAKSWLAHHAVSPETKALPWKSGAVEDADKLSPIAASALLLGYLKSLWDQRFPEAPFDRQRIVVTVPASFDVASQQATLEAAKQAGFPDSVRLLEEPQAAFYRWLETGGEENLARPGDRILVVDIGGGTSDFSLFEVGEGSDAQGRARIERVAVSDHILLGGDNIDLALAYALESELTGDDEELSADQWSHLIARSRELKERCLAGDDDVGDSEEVLSVSLPSKGSGLLAGSRSTQVSAMDARALVLDGFFPLAPRSASPERPTGGLLEWGLPYAPDCAVTRYLAEFLRGQRPVDAVLFNGGTMASPMIRDRLLEQLAEWQEGKAPVVLSNEETDLSVARGAAHFGALIERRSGRIKSGAGRSIFLEVAGEGGSADSQLMAILPRGAQPEETFVIERENLKLAVNQLSRFQVCQGAHDMDARVGDIRSVDTEGFMRLPALETRIDLPEISEDSFLPVVLRSSINELGLLQVECVSADPSISGSWSLDFNLRDALDRASSGEATTEMPSNPQVDEKRLQRACGAARARLGGGSKKNDSLKASRVFKELEDALGCPKHDWDLTVSRRLAEAILASRSVIDRSEAHAESWLQLAGYLLRPGFGHPADPERIEALWPIVRRPERFATRGEVQALILLRRLAGGLDAERQEALFAEQWPLARERRKARAERIRLLGSLERLSQSSKSELADWCLEMAVSEARSDGHPAPFLAALGQLLNRTLFHAGPEDVAPPEKVVGVFDRLAKLDWNAAGNAELIPLFLKAARVVGDRSLNVPRRSASRIVTKLKKAGVSEPRLLPLEDYVPLSRADVTAAYGESLPPGLSLG